MLSLINYNFQNTLSSLVNARASGDVGIGPVFRHLQTAFCSPAHLGGSSVYNDFSFLYFYICSKNCIQGSSQLLTPTPHLPCMPPLPGAWSEAPEDSIIGGLAAGITWAPKWPPKAGISAKKYCLKKFCSLCWDLECIVQNNIIFQKYSYFSF